MRRIRNTRAGRPPSARLARIRLVLTLLLSAAMIALVGTRLADSPVQGVPECEFWRMKLSWRHCADVVVCGDSRVYRGVSPSQMKGLLGNGLRILNFGFSSAGFAEDYLHAAEQVLDPKSTRKTIVLGITPHSLTPNAIRDNGFRDAKRELSRETIVTRHCGILRSFFKPVHPRAVLGAILGQRNSGGYYQDYRPDGWVSSTYVPENPTSAIGAYKRAFAGNRVSEDVVLCTLQAVKRWHRNGIEVYGFRVPSSSAVLTVEREHSGFDEQDFARRFARAGGMWIDVPQTSYHSYDGSHLHSNEAVCLGDVPGKVHEKDACALSRDVASAILDRRGRVIAQEAMTREHVRSRN